MSKEKKFYRSTRLSYTPRGTWQDLNLRPVDYKSMNFSFTTPSSLLFESATYVDLPWPVIHHSWFGLWYEKGEQKSSVFEPFFHDETLDNATE